MILMKKKTRLIENDLGFDFGDIVVGLEVVEVGVGVEVVDKSSLKYIARLSQLMISILSRST